MFACSFTGGSIRFCVKTLRLYTLVCPVSGCSIRLIVQPQMPYTFVCTTMEALYVCVSSQ